MRRRRFMSIPFVVAERSAEVRGGPKTRPSMRLSP